MHFASCWLIYIQIHQWFPQSTRYSWSISPTGYSQVLNRLVWHLQLSHEEYPYAIPAGWGPVSHGIPAMDYPYNHSNKQRGITHSKNQWPHCPPEHQGIILLLGFITRGSSQKLGWCLSHWCMTWDPCSKIFKNSMDCMDDAFHLQMTLALPISYTQKSYQ